MYWDKEIRHCIPYNETGMALLKEMVVNVTIQTRQTAVKFEFYQNTNPESMYLITQN